MTRLRGHHLFCATLFQGSGDAAALAAVGLQPGQRLSPSQAGERLRQVTESQWESVCAGCRWRKAGLCSWGLFQRLRAQRFV